MLAILLILLWVPARASLSVVEQDIARWPLFAAAGLTFLAIWLFMALLGWALPRLNRIRIANLIAAVLLAGFAYADFSGLLAAFGIGDARASLVLWDGVTILALVLTLVYAKTRRSQLAFTFIAGVLAASTVLRLAWHELAIPLRTAVFVEGGPAALRRAPAVTVYHVLLEGIGEAAPALRETLTAQGFQLATNGAADAPQPPPQPPPNFLHLVFGGAEPAAADDPFARLRQLGYRLIAAGQRCPAGADRCLRTRPDEDLLRAGFGPLLRVTPLAPSIEELSARRAGSDLVRLDWILERLRERRIRRAYVRIDWPVPGPHPAFDEACGLLAPTGEAWSAARRQLYDADLACLKARLDEALATIAAQDRRAIVLIEARRGPGFAANERNLRLRALRLPAACRDLGEGKALAAAIRCLELSRAPNA